MQLNQVFDNDDERVRKNNLGLSQIIYHVKESANNTTEMSCITDFALSHEISRLTRTFARF